MSVPFHPNNSNNHLVLLEHHETCADPCPQSRTHLSYYRHTAHISADMLVALEPARDSPQMRNPMYPDHVLGRTTWSPDACAVRPRGRVWRSAHARTDHVVSPRMRKRQTLELGFEFHFESLTVPNVSHWQLSCTLEALETLEIAGKRIRLQVLPKTSDCAHLSLISRTMAQHVGRNRRPATLILIIFIYFHQNQCVSTLYLKSIDNPVIKSISLISDNKLTSAQTLVSDTLVKVSGQHLDNLRFFNWSSHQHHCNDSYQLVRVELNNGENFAIYKFKFEGAFEVTSVYFCVASVDQHHHATSWTNLGREFSVKMWEIKFLNLKGIWSFMPAIVGLWVNNENKIIGVFIWLFQFLVNFGMFQAFFKKVLKITFFKKHLKITFFKQNLKITLKWFKDTWNAKKFCCQSILFFNNWIIAI